MNKTVYAVRHVAFEDLACFEEPLRVCGYDIRYFDAGIDDLAHVDAVAPELLVILGGPIGAYEDRSYPFLSYELRIIRQRLDSKRPLMGICLGAQLIARALGSRVYPGPEKEIGFAPITLTEAGKVSCLSAFDSSPVLHWHRDTFDLPEGATLLASTPQCQSQAYAYGPNVIAFQFHPEGIAVGFERWLIGHAVELSAAGVAPGILRGDFARLCDGLRENAASCLNQWLSQLRSDEFRTRIS